MNRRIEFLPLSKLKANPRNPKAHDVKALKRSIARFGFIDAVIIDERTQQLVSGHGRVEALAAMFNERGVGNSEATPPAGVAPSIIDDDGHDTGWRVPVQRGWSSRDDTEAEAFIIAANRLVETGGYDDAKLEAVLKDLASSNALDGIGFDSGEIERILADAARRDFVPQADADEVPEQPPARAQRGEVYQLGRHRLMCGDSTSAEDVARLLDGERVDLVFTDPPYASAQQKYVEFQDTKENVARLINGFLPVARGVAQLVVITPGILSLWLYPEPTWVLCWYTPASTGRVPWGFGSWQPVLAFGKDPLLATGKGGHPDVVKTTGRERFESSHPCPKPADSWQALLERVSLDGAKFLDFFCGSGTSLVVAERSGRTCFAMELSPAYVDLAITRWEKFTGKTAVRL